MPNELTDLQRRSIAVGNRVAEINERGGVDALVAAFDEYFHPDFEWVPGLSGLGADMYTGREGFREFIADMNTIAAESTVRTVEVRPVGQHHMLALGHIHFVGRGSDLTLDSESAVVYRMDVGRIRSGRSFLSHAQAERVAAEEANVGA